MIERNFRRLTRSYALVSQIRALGHSDQSWISRSARAIVLRVEYQFLPHYFGSVPRWRLRLRRVSSRRRVLPDFAVVGPIKGGSSDLVSHLMLHPNILPPLAKEPPSPDPDQWRPYYPTKSEVVRKERKVGRVRSGYLAPFMHQIQLINNLRSAVRDAKIVMTLRDPVARAFSHWKWEVFLAGRGGRSLPYFQSFANYVAMALDLFPDFPMDTRCGFPLLQTGIYHKAAELWIDRFGRENVLVLNIEDYFQDRGSQLRKIFRFLDLPDFSIPGSAEKINENPLAFDPPDDPTQRALERFYRPRNRKLFDLIGQDFGW